MFENFFFPEDGGNRFLRNVESTASLPKTKPHKQMSLTENCSASVRLYHLGSHCTDLCEIRCSWQIL